MALRQTIRRELALPNWPGLGCRIQHAQQVSGFQVRIAVLNGLVARSIPVKRKDAAQPLTKV